MPELPISLDLVLQRRLCAMLYEPYGLALRDEILPLVEQGTPFIPIIPRFGKKPVEHKKRRMLKGLH